MVVCEYGQPVPAGKEKQICIVKAGVGGDDTVRAKKRVDKDDDRALAGCGGDYARRE